MTQYNLESLLAPISDDTPSGEDLEYDAEFLALERAVGDNIKAAEDPDWHKVIELSEAIKEYVDLHNSHPKPFVWTAKANDILQKVIRANRRLSSKNNEALR